MPKIDAQEAYYIKLGRGGEWEEACLRDGTLRFGYNEASHADCVAGKWDVVLEFWRGVRGDNRTASSDTNQIRIFYEADATALFITFSGGKMHWCRAARGVELLAGDGRMRRTVDGWRSESAGGKPLTTDRLSGGLLKVQGFRGTICRVQARDYLIRKINDEVSPEVAAAEDAERAMTSAIVGLIRRLTWQDFELLVELVFSNSGWRRIGVVGRTQKTADIELVLPTTDERAFVQIKSAAGDAELRDYEERFAAAPAYDRMFFVWHTGHLSAEAQAPGITLLGPDRLARMVLDAGLASWLREKVS